MEDTSAYGEFPLRAFLGMEVAEDSDGRLVATAAGTFTTFSV